MAHRRTSLHRTASPQRGNSRTRGLVAACLCALGVASLSLAGCAYRMDIQQGNIVEREAIEQVRVGMTRSQVQFLLGTPMIADPFHADRWDYPYYYIRGRRGETARRWFTVHFENDRVARIEHHVGGPASVPDLGSEDELPLETAARD